MRKKRDDDDDKMFCCNIIQFHWIQFGSESTEPVSDWLHIECKIENKNWKNCQIYMLLLTDLCYSDKNIICCSYYSSTVKIVIYFVGVFCIFFLCSWCKITWSLIERQIKSISKCCQFLVNYSWSENVNSILLQKYTLKEINNNSAWW